MDLKKVIRDIPDYPKPGVLFRDVTTLLADPDGLAFAIDELTREVSRFQPTLIAGIEARGFVIGGAVAKELSCGFVAVRKKGKLPCETIGEDYSLEYGTDRLEIHVDALKQGDRVVLIDDLIATGGTVLAAARLVRRTGARIAGAGFIVDLPDLGGSEQLEREGIAATSLVAYPGA